MGMKRETLKERDYTVMDIEMNWKAVAVCYKVFLL